MALPRKKPVEPELQDQVTETSALDEKALKKIGRNTYTQLLNTVAMLKNIRTTLKNGLTIVENEKLADPKVVELLKNTLDRMQKSETLDELESYVSEFKKHVNYFSAIASRNLKEDKHQNLTAFDEKTRELNEIQKKCTPGSTTFLEVKTQKAALQAQKAKFIERNTRSQVLLRNIQDDLEKSVDMYSALDSTMMQSVKDQYEGVLSETYLAVLKKVVTKGLGELTELPEVDKFLKIGLKQASDKLFKIADETLVSNEEEIQKKFHELLNMESEGVVEANNKEETNKNKSLLKGQKLFLTVAAMVICPQAAIIGTVGFGLAAVHDIYKKWAELDKLVTRSLERAIEQQIEVNQVKPLLKQKADEVVKRKEMREGQEAVKHKEENIVIIEDHIKSSRPGRK